MTYELLNSACNNTSLRVTNTSPRVTTILCIYFVNFTILNSACSKYESACNKYDSAYLLRESGCKILNSACNISPQLCITNTSLRVMNIDLRERQHRTMRDPL